MENILKQAFSWMNPKLEVRLVPKYGKDARGVFAMSNIKKNEVLAVFGGYIVPSHDLKKLSKKNADTGLQISDSFSIVNKNNRENSDHFNHNCNPSAGIRGQIFLVAMRKIKEGEEVTFDYAMVLQKMKGIKPYNMKCLCGSKKCRGFITENDWKKKCIQKSYDGYFQFFIQEKINRINKK